MTYRTAKNAEAMARYWGKSLDKPDWYRLESDTEDSAEVFIYDVIGWPFNDASEFTKSLAKMTAKTITVRINSPGGDVFDGLAIYNAIREHKSKIITKIDGIAASMASIIALAGSEVQSHSNALMMIHEPWTMAAGNQYDMRDIADILEKISGNMLDIYYGKAGSGKREFKQMMRDETWFTAKEAKDRNLIDVIIDAPAAKAAFDLSMFANVPDGFYAHPEGRDLTPREIERALRDAGASRSFAKAIIAEKVKPLRDAELATVANDLVAVIEKFKEKNNV